MNFAKLFTLGMLSVGALSVAGVASVAQAGVIQIAPGTSVRLMPYEEVEASCAEAPRGQGCMCVPVSTASSYLNLIYVSINSSGSVVRQDVVTNLGSTACEALMKTSSFCR